MVKLKSFCIIKDNKSYDYRLGEKLILNDVTRFFEKKYHVEKIWSGARHVLGFLKKKKKKYFLKLATTQGISLLTENEFYWNESFNREIKRGNSPFCVPKNYDSGFYHKDLFYLITDRFDGQMLGNLQVKKEISDTFIRNLRNVIDFSELIQNLKNINSNRNSEIKNTGYQDWFISKTKLWYQDIPKTIIKKFEINKLLDTVVRKASILTQKPRHGDFTPWHLIALKSGKLGLIDGEHALTAGVECYDISYIIQRVYSVLKNPKLAKHILRQLKKRKYNIEKLKIVMAARSIGGYLDESLAINPDYKLAREFQMWVLGL